MSEKVVPVPTKAWVSPSSRLLAVQKLKDLGVTAKIDLVELDVTNDQQITTVINHVTNTYGRLDVLINNAGIIRLPSKYDLSAARNTYNEILNVNITSVALITTA
ncbi:uncharacterized protein ACHE_10860S [Aspergillus chevalieri]|uniref:Uncharacterized protein n=1 Tax=Aspergillus chevalieri TaxID=182096 RepID=A0A7R7VEX9_ASPCH|nr:uncharacterized protein ACHE_10860S [Aspergillus chevalieri]BCR83458.1 hypothetical protein ACHE_10860S [Aspergillus chevalieri]